MKLLLIADEESPYLWDYYQPGRLDDIDLILSSGDLDPSYLSFLVTMGHAPLFYIHGNHDGIYERKPPEGCTCIEDQLVVYRGLRILGLGGSGLYSGGPHQYTEAEMEKRIKKLRLKLRLYGGVDLVLTHAPIRGLGDQEDLCHRGFEAFKPLLDRYRPQYLIHGHIHTRYIPGESRFHQYGDTQVINACDRYLLELPDPTPEMLERKPRLFRRKSQ